jgi:putative addiction module component (TIGR02574 family)
MDFELLEKQALCLSVDERARLVRALLASIENLAPYEIESLWLDLAEQRAAAIDRDTTTLVSSDDVSKKARALLTC